MSYTYNLTTDIGKIRLLIPDRIESEAMFSDEELSEFLSLEFQVKTAAALALETIAADETLVQKRITLLDLSTDGPAVAKALLDRAKALRDQTKAVASDAELVDDGGFAIASPAYYPFGVRELMGTRRD